MISDKPIFEYTKDVYNSRYISLEAVKNQKGDFSEALKNTIVVFREDKTKGLFLDLSLVEHSNLFPIVSS